VREFCVWISSRTIGVTLSSTTMGDFARVDVHAGENGHIAPRSACAVTGSSFYHPLLASRNMNLNSKDSLHAIAC
jgi:hypothetical protein